MQEYLEVRPALSAGIHRRLVVANGATQKLQSKKRQPKKKNSIEIKRAPFSMPFWSAHPPGYILSCDKAAESTPWPMP